MKYQNERPSWKELTTLHIQAASLCAKIDLMQQDREQYLEFLNDDFMKELPEHIQDRLLDGLDIKDRAIARRKDEYQNLINILKA